MTKPTNKFGVRQWGANGQLLTEYWVVHHDPSHDAVAVRRTSLEQEQDQCDVHIRYTYRHAAAFDESAGGTASIATTATAITTTTTTAAAATATPPARPITRVASTTDLIAALEDGTPRSSSFPRSAAAFTLLAGNWRKRPAPRRPRPSTTSCPSSTSMSIESVLSTKSPLNMPASPERKQNLWKRLSHVRKRSHTANEHVATLQQQQQQQKRPTSPDPNSRPPTRSQTAPSTDTSTKPDRSPIRRPSLTNGTPEQSTDSVPRVTLNDDRNQSHDVSYPDGLTPLSSHRSTKVGIKWAEKLGETPPTRPRRTSSAATHGRRSSIYSKAAEGDYLEGVDAGVGSKARRLSVVLPDELVVDECPLEEHFSLFSRLGQKDIGEGGAAIVRLMKSKTAGTGKDRVFAVKEFRPRDDDEENEYEYERKIKSEYAISKSCQHPNVVETFRLCHTGERWFHVMEYCELGDLNDLINRNYFSREDRNCLFKQLVRGVDFLHERGIAHRDLKSENILITKDGCLKIADFGTGEVFCGRHPGARNCRRQSVIDPKDPIRLCAPGWVGSRPYMAPEIFQRKGEYDPRAVDVWSVAIVYLTLCFGGNPWDAAGPEVKNFNIYCNTWDDWLEKYPDGEIRKDRELPAFVYTKQFMMLDDMGTKRLMFGMLHPDPAKRWTIRQVLECKTVNEAACCQQEGYSDDIKKRQKKALHNHVPPKDAKHKTLKPS